MHVLNTKPKENSLVYVYFLFWITFKFILLPSAVSFRYYPINDYGFDNKTNKVASFLSKKNAKRYTEMPKYAMERAIYNLKNPFNNKRGLIGKVM